MANCAEAVESAADKSAADKSAEDNSAEDKSAEDILISGQCWGEILEKKGTWLFWEDIESGGFS